MGNQVSTISENSKLQPATSIKFNKLTCQVRALLLPVPLAGTLSTSKLISYFSSHPVAFGFQASSPSDNTTLNPVNKMTDQSLSDLQTGTGVAAHATFDIEQLILHTRTVLVDTIASI